MVTNPSHDEQSNVTTVALRQETPSGQEYFTKDVDFSEGDAQWVLERVQSVEETYRNIGPNIEQRVKKLLRGDNS
ncbi:hypothetical protein SAMN05216241_107115 [Limimonas halophila]|uniref:Uncharacterized protein n=1 Tax=Limimonas halophila TaxID=1082479 RepID=A0A1G7SSR3_9PROT|nr:hypothetical protein SAMN05216241_107115 [Limimonas halophila]